MVALRGQSLGPAQDRTLASGVTAALGWSLISAFLPGRVERMLLGWTC